MGNKAAVVRAVFAAEVSAVAGSAVRETGVAASVAAVSAGVPRLFPVLLEAAVVQSAPRMTLTFAAVLV